MSNIAADVKVVPMEVRLANLKDCVAIQCFDGNWNYDRYMHGMANGLILALAVMEGCEPKYLEAPEQWLKDVETDSDLAVVSEGTD